MLTPFGEILCTPFGRGGGVWTADLWITAPLLLAAGVYARGVASVWLRAGAGRGIPGWRVGCYAAGWLTLVLALVSPIHRWGGELFTIHMVEHELVMAVAAPLLVLGRPGGAFAWAMPGSVRHRLAPVLRRSGARGCWTVLTRPAVATILHGTAIWAWHAPVLFELARVDVAVHRVQHVSFLVTGLLFWWALVRRRHSGIAAGHLFATMLHTSVLGALIALAPRVLYPVQTLGALQWGFTPLQDQQLAGLLMWIPAGLVYAAAALAFFAEWISRAGIGGATGHPMAGRGELRGSAP